MSKKVLPNKSCVIRSGVKPKADSYKQLLYSDEIRYCWLELGKHPADIKEAVV